MRHLMAVLAGLAWLAAPALASAKGTAHRAHPTEAHVNAHQHTERHKAAADRFRVLTNYPRGRPGYVVDHVIPLCAGGADEPSNMQWQSEAEAKAKDRLEKAQCAALRKQYEVDHIIPGSSRR